MSIDIDVKDGRPEEADEFLPLAEVLRSTELGKSRTVSIKVSIAGDREKVARDALKALSRYALEQGVTLALPKYEFTDAGVEFYFTKKPQIKRARKFGSASPPLVGPEE